MLTEVLADADKWKTSIENIAKVLMERKIEQAKKLEEA
jgi:hypothetical protein